MDALLDSTVDMQDVFRDDDINMDAPIERPAAQPKTKDEGDTLGVEEEVKVTRKRQPVAKLDEDRLLSQAGIPKLRRIAKERLHFKGKGHEYRDLARLLNIYQLWLDDLYPRAKFADGLAMLEKLGHKKRIQIMRREWIQEGKPREKYDEIEATKESEGTSRPEDELRHRDTTRNNADLVDTVERQPMPNTNLSGLAGSDEAETLFLPKDITDNEPSEDDLDALIAETADDNEGQLFINPSSTNRHEPDTRKDDFDDEEALAAMGNSTSLDHIACQQALLIRSLYDFRKTPNFHNDYYFILASQNHNDQQAGRSDLKEGYLELVESDMELLAAIEKLQLKATSLESQTDELLSKLKEETRPKNHSVPSRETLTQELEAGFLQPPSEFNYEWLNKLQQRWEISTNLTSLFELAPTQTRSRIRFIREGLEGKVTGYKEVTVPATSATAKNSTSFLRRPANKADFVRGAAGFFPFAPGGLDDIQAVADSEDRLSRDTLDTEISRPSALDRVIQIGPEKRLLEVPPGFTRGLRFDEAKTTVDKNTASQIEESLSQEPTDHGDNQNEAASNVKNHLTNGDGHEAQDAEGEPIDDLLPVEFAALQPHGILAASTSKRGGKEWAHMVDVKREITNFSELIPDMARTWPFELDTFQKEAVYHLENGDSVFVAAHTSAGKTVVAEYAIALAAKHMTKAVYTSPIKALSNQKFRDFRKEFDDVGILTGDVQINPEASCLIMTTEILRSMLYRGADLLRDVEYVIFDEVHYVNDIERGVVWEEVIIMLPEHVTLILLSATVPNTYEFASWVGRTKKKDVYVISTPKRPVPLEHFLWADKAMHKIVDANKKFLDQGWKEANLAMSGRDNVKTATSTENATAALGGTNTRGRGQAQRGGAQKPGGQRGRGQPQRGVGNIARTGRGGGRTTAAQDRNVWVHLVQHLRKHELLPACIFVFSKNRCEQNADALSNLDFSTASEKSATHTIIERSIARLKPDDRLLPQIRRLRELLSRGIAVHHGGLLPIVKEIVEILFAKTLVKVLFATETFAMGLNLPTRTVVFSGFRKHDGRNFRELLPGEYTQMAGRAGRRGLDPVGSVIIVNQGSEEAPPAATLKQMILGDPTKLRSQFRLTYNMILNLLRVEALKIEEMIKRSFSENAAQALLPQHEKHVKLSESDLAKIKREQCDICDHDLVHCHENAIGFQSATLDLHMKSVMSPVGRRMVSAKRLIVFRMDDVRTMGILLRDNISRGPPPTIEVLSMRRRNPSPDPSDLLPYLPKFRRFFAPLPGKMAEMDIKVTRVGLNDVESFTKTLVKVDLDGLLKHREEAKNEAEAEIQRICASWQSSVWDELDWNRLRDLNVRDTLDLRRQKLVEAEAVGCTECPQFVRHFSMCHSEWLIKENIDQLKQRMSDQNLQLLPDYEQRVEVLKDLGFVDGSSRVQLKGKVACEIHSADELVLTELILENVLADFEPEEIVALLSAFVFQEKTDIEPTLTASLEKGKARIIEISEKVNAFQIQHQVILSSDDSNDFVSRPRFGLVEVVHEWARGMSFNRITDLTDVLEGTIVRVITRLDETCREVKNAARIIGDPQLFTKMQSAQEMIKRDITAVASLYM